MVTIIAVVVVLIVSLSSWTPWYSCLLQISAWSEIFGISSSSSQSCELDFLSLTFQHRLKCLDGLPSLYPSAKQTHTDTHTHTQPVLQFCTLHPAKSGCQGVESINRSCLWVGEICRWFKTFFLSLLVCVFRFVCHGHVLHLYWKKSILNFYKSYSVPPGKFPWRVLLHSEYSF